MKIQFVQTVSYRGKMQTSGDVINVPDADATYLITRKLATQYNTNSTITPREKVIIETEPAEPKRIVAHHVGAGHYHIKQGDKLLKKVRGADNANKAVEELTR